MKLLNPTIALRAGQDLVVRPSGGGGGGRDAIINDDLGWIDVGRSPDPLNETHQNTAQTKLGTKLIRVQIATDRQLIATAETTNAPTTISASDILKIYSGTITTWSEVTGYSGSAGAEKIIPLHPPDRRRHVEHLPGQRQAAEPGQRRLHRPLEPEPDPGAAERPDRDHQPVGGRAQERDRAVPAWPLPDAQHRLLHATTGTTNAYNTETGHRTAASAAGIKLLDGVTNTDVNQPTAPYGGNFAYNAIVRERDLNSTTPWQPGSTLNWVKALFYNPDGPKPFVRTPAGERC